MKLLISSTPATAVALVRECRAPCDIASPTPSSSTPVSGHGRTRTSTGPSPVAEAIEAIVGDRPVLELANSLYTGFSATQPVKPPKRSAPPGGRGCPGALAPMTPFATSPRRFSSSSWHRASTALGLLFRVGLGHQPVSRHLAFREPPPCAQRARGLAPLTNWVSSRAGEQSPAGSAPAEFTTSTR